MLQFLWGHPWDTLAENFVHALQPSCVRVSDGEIKTDSMPQRVTVYVREGKILRIEQECEIGLAGGFTNGHDLHIEASRRGINLR